jgi:hypothetical protein
MSIYSDLMADYQDAVTSYIHSDLSENPEKTIWATVGTVDHDMADVMTDWFHFEALMQIGHDPETADYLKPEIARHLANHFCFQTALIDGIPYSNFDSRDLAIFMNTWEA